jgi:hypothetical protein
MEATWGLLGPEFLPNARRTRTLGLGASVRSFNDLAVPGLGGVWYGKQLLLATLGVAVAKQARSRGAQVQNIEVANAIEALACWLAFNSNGWSRDARLHGNTKLQGKTDFSFRLVRQRTFYVTQPMRMATVQPLPALGFVESDGVRFNAFNCSDEGMSFIEKATENYRPHNKSVIDFLTNWVQGESNSLTNSRPLQKALSPTEPIFGGAIPLLRERILQGGNESYQDKERRGNALAWVEALRTSSPDKHAWDKRPKEISAEHWHDLRTGASFFKVREAAIRVLDAAEILIGNQTAGQSIFLKAKVPDDMSPAFEQLASAANEYLAFTHSDEEAKKFACECIVDNLARILRTLVERDGHVLRLVGDEVRPGPAFRATHDLPQAAIYIGDNDDQDSAQTVNISLPDGISHRVRNLYLLNLDMHGELDGRLNPSVDGGEA